ncbi:MAG: DUF3231 family protein [Bacillota bacterium]
MENINHNVRLSSSELAALWTQFQNDSLTICFIDHSLKNVVDQDIREVLELAIGLSKSHIEKIKEFFNQDNYPFPKGFTKEDVNLDAPPLFSDPLILDYMYVMTLQGLTGYAGAVGTSVRADVRSYFIQCITETTQLYDKIVEIMLQKGIFSRSPSINTPEQIDFVKNQQYLKGWFGKQRPLNVVEISGFCFNVQKLMIKIVLEIGFSQVTSSKELRKYFQRGAALCQKHVKTFDSILAEDDLHSPRKWESEVTNSTVPPFSDKLMLYHIVSLVSTAIGFYGLGLSVVQRRDLVAQYTTLIGEISLYSEDGMNLMINNGWLEQPPMADDRNALANRK